MFAQISFSHFSGKETEAQRGKNDTLEITELIRGPKAPQGPFPLYGLFWL